MARLASGSTAAAAAAKATAEGGTEVEGEGEDNGETAGGQATGADEPTSHIIYREEGDSDVAAQMAASSGLDWTELSYGVYGLCGTPSACARAVADASASETNEGTFVCATPLPPLDVPGPNLLPLVPAPQPQQPVQCLAVGNTLQCAPQTPPLDLLCLPSGYSDPGATVVLPGSTRELEQHVLQVPSVISDIATDMSLDFNLSWTRLARGVNSLCGSADACTAALANVAHAAFNFSCVRPAPGVGLNDVVWAGHVHCIAFNGAEQCEVAQIPAQQDGPAGATTTDGSGTGGKDGTKRVKTTVAVLVIVFVLLVGVFFWLWRRGEEQRKQALRSQPVIEEVTVAMTRNIMYDPHVPLNAPLAGGGAADNAGEAAGAGSVRAGGARATQGVPLTPNVLYNPHVPLNAPLAGGGSSGGGSNGRGDDDTDTYTVPNDLYAASAARDVETNSSNGGGGNSGNSNKVVNGMYKLAGKQSTVAAATTTASLATSSVVYLIPMATAGDGKGAGVYMAPVTTADGNATYMSIEETQYEFGRGSSTRSVRSVAGVTTSARSGGGGGAAAPSAPADANHIYDAWGKNSKKKKLKVSTMTGGGAAAAAIKRMKTATLTSAPTRALGDAAAAAALPASSSNGSSSIYNVGVPPPRRAPKQPQRSTDAGSGTVAAAAAKGIKLVQLYGDSDGGDTSSDGGDVEEDGAGASTVISPVIYAVAVDAPRGPASSRTMPHQAAATRGVESAYAVAEVADAHALPEGGRNAEPLYRPVYELHHPPNKHGESTSSV